MESVITSVTNFISDPKQVWVTTRVASICTGLVASGIPALVILAQSQKQLSHRVCINQWERMNFSTLIKRFNSKNRDTRASRAEQSEHEK